MTQAIARQQSSTEHGRNGTPAHVNGHVPLPAYAQTAVQPRCFSVNEYERMITAGAIRESERVELLEGVIVEMAAIGSRHSARVDVLMELLFPLLSSRRAGLRIQNPIKLSASELQPDVALVRHRPEGYNNAIPDAADTYLAIEVSYSTVGIDRRFKLPTYARDGITEVWLVNLDADLIEVYREPSGGRYRSRNNYARGDTISPLTFPDFTLSVSDILGPPGITEAS